MGDFVRNAFELKFFEGGDQEIIRVPSNFSSEDYDFNSDSSNEEVDTKSSTNITNIIMNIEHPNEDIVILGDYGQGSS